MSLPVELLEIIFNFCYLASIGFEEYSYQPSPSDCLRTFPYSLAAVDPSWNAMLLKHRKYWSKLTRVVFNVDSKTPTHIADAKTILQYISTDFSDLHLAIIRHSKTNPDDAAEKEHVRNLMDLLEPNLRYFQSFLIDVHA